ncbi:diaminobutyrate--2-oxoglutarate transaminase [Clavibacter michiganensis]|uniref:diaminobutyrate--2-oxoglutarate transaminase n=1 Tax=Clavibacter michiganensis TaxID=28447 RepID=UPI003EBEAD22
MSIKERHGMTIFEQMESEVRSYSRGWPVVFDRAVGSEMFTADGDRYLDFFAGAGALNYGHNNPGLKQKLVDYILRDGVTHSLDMFTEARRDFLQTFQDVILQPRGLDYRIMFPGPGGANAVEAALKLARKVTGRTTIVHFTNSFHGMTEGALAVTGNALKRGGAGHPLHHAVAVPFDGYLGGETDSLAYFEKLLDDSGSGFDTPAGVIVETVQGEGGINVATPEWLRKLRDLTTRHGIVLIVDDVQMGCGRTGGFFSFEESGIVPDIVTLSKSIGGYGLPMALTLLKPELDQWKPGEHNGTFRGIAPAFLTGAEALRLYWADGELEASTLRKGERIHEVFTEIAASAAPEMQLKVRGRGLARGIEFPSGDLAGAVCRAAFERGMLMETSGAGGTVMKVLPALTITDDEVEEGLAIIRASVAEVLGSTSEELAADEVPLPVVVGS